LSSNRFTFSFDFIRQYTITSYSRQPLIDSCVDRLENGQASIVNCPDEDRSYTEYTKCRVYFRKEKDILLDLEFF